MPAEAASGLLSVEDALDRILAAMPEMPAEDVMLTDGLGRILAVPAISRRTQPPFAVSAMDGYAVRSADVKTCPVDLKRIGSVPAGTAFAGTVGAGEAVRIFTGGRIPDGADAIVIQEDVDAPSEEDGVMITVREGVAAGTYVRDAGLDFREGDTGIPAGRRLTARDIGLAAAMNLPWLRVRRKPRVAVLASGDEIARPGDPVGENQIVSSNGLALCALIAECGGVAINLGIAPDTEDGLRSMAAGARGADLLITTGGASVGEHDLVQKALGVQQDGSEALEVDFWRIAMRPGKPLIFGRIGQTPMLGLPGNPVSTLVCATIFLQPALAAMLRAGEPTLQATSAILASPLGANDRRQDYVRARLETGDNGAVQVRAFSRQDSSMLSRLAQADCLIVRPPHDPARAAGETVEVLPLPGGGIRA
jgi:molybdopterin molybdotransferase